MSIPFWIYLICALAGSCGACCLIWSLYFTGSRQAGRADREYGSGPVTLGGPSLTVTATYQDGHSDQIELSARDTNTDVITVPLAEAIAHGETEDNQRPAAARNPVGLMLDEPMAGSPVAINGERLFRSHVDHDAIMRAAGGAGWYDIADRVDHDRQFNLPNMRLPRKYKAAFTSAELFEQQSNMHTYDHGLASVLESFRCIMNSILSSEYTLRDYNFSMNFSSASSTTMKRYSVLLRAPVEGQVDLVQRVMPDLTTQWSASFLGQDYTFSSPSALAPVQAPIAPLPQRNQRMIDLG